MQQESIQNNKYQKINEISVSLLSFFIFFPHFFYAFVGIGSYTLGVVFCCLVFLVLKLYLIKRKLISRKKMFISVLLFFFIYAQGLFSSHNSPSFEYVRFFSSVFLFLIFLITSKYFGQLILEQDDASFEKNIKVVLFIFLLNSFAPLIGIELFKSNAPVGIFQEPSFFALTIAPFLFYISVIKLRGYILLLMYFLVWGLVIESLIMILVVSGCITLIILKKSKFFILLLPIAFVLIIPNIKSDYYLERLDLSNDSANISVLFYVKGWEIATQAFKDTSGFGLGFQQLGYIELSETHPATQQLEAWNLGHMAKHGGSGVAAKLIADFGVFGLLFIVLLITFYIRVLFLLFNKKQNSMLKAEIFLICCVVSLFYEILIRDFGYFSMGSFFFFGALFNLTIKSKNNKQLSVSIKPASGI
jgi:hypothetical protein